MNLVAREVIAFGIIGTYRRIFQFCSSKCSIRGVGAAFEEEKKQIQLCPCCRKLNEEILRAAAEPSGAIALGFSDTFQFCSIKCSMQGVATAIEEVKKQTQLYPCCRKMNEEIPRSAALPACAVEADRCLMSQGPKINHAEAAPKPSKNPYFNYLLEQRPNSCGGRSADFAVCQAKTWNAMTEAQKEKYTKSAINANKSKERR